MRAGPARWWQTSYDPQFLRAINRAAAVVAVGSLLSVTALAATSFDPAPTWLTSAAIATYALVAGTFCIIALVDSRTPLGLRAMATWAFFFVPFFVWGCRSSPDDPTMSPLAILLIVSLIATTPAFGIASGVAAAFLLGGLIWWIRLPGVEDSQAVLEGVNAAMATAVAALGTEGLHRRMTTATAAVLAADSSSHEADLGTERARAQEHFGEVVHNFVLAALLRATAIHDAESRAGARLSAQLALRALHEPQGGPTLSWREGVDAIARANGLRVSSSQRGHPQDPHITAALLDAVAEALNNVRKHSGTREASVAATFAPRRSSVTVSDRGRGFDPARVAGDRLGIAAGIVSRVLGVGGRASVRSSPGSGTSLSLTVPHPTSAIASVATMTPEPRPTWFLVVALVLAQLAYPAIGLLYLDSARVPWLSYAVMAMSLWSLYRLLLLDPRNSPWRRYAAITFIAPLICLLNTTGLESGDWRVWFIGMIDANIVVLALRISPQAALGGTFFCSAGIALIMTLTTRSIAPGIVINAIFQLWAWGIVATFLRWGFQATSRRVLQAQARLEREEQRRRLAELREAHFRDNVDQLDRDVHDLLALIASPARLSPTQQRDCGIAESVLRDRIRYPDLLDPATSAAMRLARRRGVRIELALDALDDDAAGVSLRHFLAVLLPQLDPGESVRVTSFGNAAPAMIVLQAAPRRLADLERLLGGLAADFRFDRGDHVLIAEISLENVPDLRQGRPAVAERP